MLNRAFAIVNKHRPARRMILSGIRNYCCFYKLSKGPNEILENGKRGTLVPVGDVKALVKVILTAFDEEQSRGLEGAKDFCLSG